MKIIFIQPRAGRFNPSYIHEPLNLGYLASYLKSKGFENVEIIVSAFQKDESIIEQCSKADLIGFTATSPMMKHALQIARELKNLNPFITTVMGGAHASIEPDETLANHQVDFVIRGEGEVTFFELASSLRSGKGVDFIAGLSYKKNGTVIHSRARQLIPDLDQLPFPDRASFGQEKFLAIGFKKYGDRGAWVLSSRGCPYLCTYCASNKVWTRKWRPRSSENIIAEIKMLKEIYGVDRINFADDTFTVSKKRVIEFCELIREAGLNIAWACNTRVDNIDADILTTMQKAGCIEVWMGVESGSPAILSEIKKDLNPQDIRSAFRWAREAGLSTRGYFMIGSRSESRETIRETEELIDEIRPDRLAFSIMTPYPGCEEYQLWKSENGNSSIDWSEIDLLETEAVMMPTKYLTKKELQYEHLRLKEKYSHLWRI